MKELNIKNKLAATIKQNMKDRKIAANDSDHEIGCDVSPVNTADEFFEVAIESPKFHLNSTQDEFFSTKGDSELNVTKNV
jgi:hypothetical protein